MPKSNDRYVFPRRLPNIMVSPEEAIELIEKYSGITTHDYFIAHGPWDIHSYMAWFSQFRNIKEETSSDITKRIAKLNIEYADAMIAEMNKE